MGIEVEGEYGLEKCKEAGEVDIPQTAARLLATIVKPSVEYDDAADSVTVAWSTGPTVTEGSATVSCYSVLLGAEPITCKNLDEATPFGTDNVVYDKTLTKETYESTLDLPLDISSAQCFIEGEGGLEKCKEAGEVDIPQPARLLATIVKPSVEADPATNSFEVSWSTLGAVTDGLYEVACYQLIDGADPITCKDLPENPDFSAVGEYDKALMKESYAVEFSDLETFDGVTFQCFIAVEGEYGVEKCKEAGEAVFPALPNGDRSTEDPDRLVAHIMKPSVEYNDATDTVTVAWSTGPTVTEGSATVS